MTQPLLIIMAKAPRPGTVKTRLTPVLSAAAAAELATAFLLDTVAKVESTKLDFMIAFAPADADEEISALVGPVRMVPQTGDNLGDRMEHAFIDGFAAGFAPIVMIGTDCPELSASIIVSAFHKLETNETVLGPTTDGGFYLIGLRSIEAGIFAGVEWSSPGTLQQTVARTRAVKKNEPAFLPELSDVDEPPDLRRLLEVVDLAALAPATAAWLAENRHFLTGK